MEYPVKTTGGRAQMGVVMEAEMGTPFRTAWSAKMIETSILFEDDIPSGKLTSILSWLMVSWFITPISLWFMDVYGRYHQLIPSGNLAVCY